jgi:hypothetical protein
MVDKSAELDQLGTALAKAQSEIEGAAKSVKNPHLRSKYADFLSVVEATRPALTSNGLSISQPITCVGNIPAINTILLHSSGQYISSIMPIEVQEQKGINMMQALGSAVSYARRYAYESIVGVARIEDDDAHKSGPKFSNGKSNGHHKLPADPKAEFERMVQELGVDDKTMSECLKYHECEDLGSVPESKRREFYKDLALTTQPEEVKA